MSKNSYKDYRITGPEKEIAIQKGLKAAEWYTVPIPRKRLKQLCLASKKYIVWQPICT